MAAMEWLCGDRRTREAILWKRWLELVPRIRKEFHAAIDDDPLFYNETASVGVLAAAASRAGLLALSEYAATKRGAGRGRPHRDGRCDLWIATPDTRRSWSFEFKQCFCSSEPRSTTIAARLDRACADAWDVHPLEADLRFGGLLISACEGQALSEKAVKRIRSVAESATYACRFDGGLGQVFLILRQV